MWNWFGRSLKIVFKILNDFPWWKQNVHFFRLLLFPGRLDTTSFHYNFMYLLHCKTTLSSLVLLCKKYGLWFIRFIRHFGWYCSFPLLQITGFHSYRLETMAGVGRRIRALFIEYGAKQMGAIWRWNWKWIATEKWIFVIKTVEVSL